MVSVATSQHQSSSKGTLTSRDGWVNIDILSRRASSCKNKFTENDINPWQMNASPSTQEDEVWIAIMGPSWSEAWTISKQQ